MSAPVEEPAMPIPPHFESMPLNDDATAAVNLYVDRNDKIYVVFQTVVTKMRDDKITNEKRQFKTTYLDFHEHVLPAILKGLGLIRDGCKETTVLHNSRHAGGK